MAVRASAAARPPCCSGLTVVLAFAALAVFWAPGMAMLSDAAEDAGLDQALAFAISNLAWAVGHVFGAGAGGAVAEATTDAVPYAALAVLCVRHARSG